MYLKNLKSDIAVIGGGAAGMIAGITAAERGLSVVIIERNNMLGKKLRITGKGRCNITNSCEVSEFFQNIPRNSRFLYSSIYGFTPDNTMAFFEELGVPLKVERGARVFPQSDKAADVVNALKKRLGELKVDIIQDRASRVETDDGKVIGVYGESYHIACRSVILCTGGGSYPMTGSTGDGYAMAKALGHSIVKMRPSLVPLESYDSYCGQMQGLSLRNVGLKMYNSKDRVVYEDFGEMLFTHYGVSGPLILSASAHMENDEKYRISIDLKPALDEKKLDARLLRDFGKYANRDFQNALSDLLNRLMIPVVVKLSGIPPELKVNSITKEQRKKLLHLLKNFPVSIKGTRPLDEAIVTAGGVSIKEVNPSTMESKIVHGLFFAGEILDVDAYTGGFNLQIAWATGHTAGENILKGE